jgi:hypothetical protein
MTTKIIRPGPIRYQSPLNPDFKALVKAIDRNTEQLQRIADRLELVSFSTSSGGDPARPWGAIRTSEIGE